MPASLMSPFLSPFLSPSGASSSPFLPDSPSLSSSLHGTCSWKKGIKCNAILQSQCTLPCPKEISLKIKKNGGEDIEILDVEFRRPYVMSFGSYVVQEAVLDEEYWAAAWLRAEIYSEGRPYFRGHRTVYDRYIDSYRKKFAEQEFTALKRRCFQKQGQSVQCICLMAVITEGSQIGIGMLPQHTLRDRVVGTLDISIRQPLRGGKFPKEIISAGLLSIIEPEHQHGYIANVCVTKQARRKGIASSLLRVAINAAKCWKLKDLYVHVNVNNAAAQRLYKKSGFQVIEDSDPKNALLPEEQLLCMYL